MNKTKAELWERWNDLYNNTPQVQKVIRFEEAIELARDAINAIQDETFVPTELGAYWFLLEGRKPDQWQAVQFSKGCNVKEAVSAFGDGEWWPNRLIPPNEQDNA